MLQENSLLLTYYCTVPFYDIVFQCVHLLSSKTLVKLVWIQNGCYFKTVKY